MDSNTSQTPPPGSNRDAPVGGEHPNPGQSASQARPAPPPPSQSVPSQAQVPPHTQNQTPPPQPTYQAPPVQQQYQAAPAQYQVPPVQQYQPQFPQQHQNPIQHVHQVQIVQPQTAKRSTWLVVLVAAAFLIVPFGVGAWFLLREPAPILAGSWPRDPQLKYSFTAAVDASSPTYVPMSGTADDLYIAELNQETSLVTRYVNGEPKWQTEVGLPTPAAVYSADDLVLVSTSRNSTYQSELSRLNPDDGSVMWTVDFDGPIKFAIDDRLFVQLFPDPDHEFEKILEYDIETGNELNRIGEATFVYTEDGFIALDDVELTAQFLDRDLKPVGEPVDVENSGNSFVDFVVNHDEDGWIYYTDRRPFGGLKSAVGLGPTGATAFECEVTIEDPTEILRRDDGTVVVASYQAIQVFDIDGSTCTTRWSVEAGTRGRVRANEAYPLIYTFKGSGESVDIFQEDADVEVLDWANGKVIGRGEDLVRTNEDGQMITFKGNILIGGKIGGDESWQIAAAPGSYVTAHDGMVVVIVGFRTSANIDVYAD